MKTNLTLPDGWQMSSSWRRAQDPHAAKNPVNESEWIVQIGDGDYHRVTFAVDGGNPVVQCDCHGYHYNRRCAHILKIWWDWVRGRAVVTDLDSGRSLIQPPAWLKVGGSN